jgi:hypothetical protein
MYGQLEAHGGSNQKEEHDKGSGVHYDIKKKDK